MYGPMEAFFMSFVCFDLTGLITLKEVLTLDLEQL